MIPDATFVNVPDEVTTGVTDGAVVDAPGRTRRSEIRLDVIAVVVDASVMTAMGNLPLGMLGSTGDALGVPVTTLITPVVASPTIQSFREFEPGAVNVPVVCCAFSTVFVPPMNR